MKLSAKDIIKATDGTLIYGHDDKTIDEFSIDSRTINKDAAFIAIKGKRYDGHDFVLDSHRKGSRFFIVDSVVIQVENTRKALGDIAVFKRRQLDIPVIAITGSAGKTTTKEMIYSILSTKYNVLKNKGTENNEIGLPCTLLNLKKDHEIAIVEMGMNKTGEIEYLSKIAEPDVGVITCIHPAHLGYLDSIENITETKWQLIKNLRKKRTAVLNNDDKQLKKKMRNYNGNVITFGIENKSDFQASSIHTDRDTIEFKINGKDKIRLNMLSKFNIYNCLAAVAIGSIFEIEFDQMKKTLASFKLPSMRMQKIKVNNITVINDGYNANPESLVLAAETLADLTKKSRSIMVCCDMLELGKFSRDLHEEAGRRIASLGIDYLICAGDQARWICKGALSSGMDKQKIRYSKNTKQACLQLKDIVQADDTILLKGSRLMKTEEIVKCFISYYIH
jgi:UDP-N-acetylmuramoyl-tripeptide--D-alanyl-D-alanine ligase